MKSLVINRKFPAQNNKQMKFQINELDNRFMNLLNTERKVSNYTRMRNYGNSIRSDKSKNRLESNSKNKNQESNPKINSPQKKYMFSPKRGTKRLREKKPTTSNNIEVFERQIFFYDLNNVRFHTNANTLNISEDAKKNDSVISESSDNKGELNLENLKQSNNNLDKIKNINIVSNNNIVQEILNDENESKNAENESISKFTNNRNNLNSNNNSILKEINENDSVNFHTQRNQNKEKNSQKTIDNYYFGQLANNKNNKKNRNNQNNKNNKHCICSINKSNINHHHNSRKLDEQNCEPTKTKNNTTYKSSKKDEKPNKIFKIYIQRNYGDSEKLSSNITEKTNKSKNKTSSDSELFKNSSKEHFKSSKSNNVYDSKSLNKSHTKENSENMIFYNPNKSNKNNISNWNIINYGKINLAKNTNSVSTGKKKTNKIKEMKIIQKNIGQVYTINYERNNDKKSKNKEHNNSHLSHNYPQYIKKNSNLTIESYNTNATEENPNFESKNIKIKSILSYHKKNNIIANDISKEIIRKELNNESGKDSQLNFSNQKNPNLSFHRRKSLSPYKSKKSKENNFDGFQVLEYDPNKKSAFTIDSFCIKKNKFGNSKNEENLENSESIEENISNIYKKYNVECYCENKAEDEQNKQKQDFVNNNEFLTTSTDNDMNFHKKKFKFSRSKKSFIIKANMNNIENNNENNENKNIKIVNISTTFNNNRNINCLDNNNKFCSSSTFETVASKENNTEHLNNNNMNTFNIRNIHNRIISDTSNINVGQSTSNKFKNSYRFLLNQYFQNDERNDEENNNEY